MSSTEKAVRSVVIVFSFTLLSKFLGFLREIVIASKFGLGEETDTFFMTVSVLSLFTTIITTSLRTTFIPVLIEVEKNEGYEGKLQFSNNALNVTLLCALFIFLFVMLLTPFVVRIMAPGFEGDQYNTLILFLRIGIPVVFISTILGITRGYLQSGMHFLESALTYIPFNFVYLFYLWTLSSKYGIKGLVIVHVLAFFSQILIQIPSLRRTGFKYKMHINFKDKYMRRMGWLIIPVLASVGVQDLNVIIDKALASMIETGSISALNYAVRLNTLVQAVFVGALTTVIFPMMSKAFGDKDNKTQNAIVQKGFVTILIVAFPAMVGLLILNMEIVSIAFHRGQFTQADVIMTSSSVFYYALGLIPMCLRVLLQNVFYSMQDTKSPLINGTITLVGNFIFSIILMQYMSYRGLALATSISVTITTVFMIRMLAKKRIRFLNRLVFLKILKIAISSVLMGVTIIILKQLNGFMLDSSFFQLSIYVIIGILIYFSSIKIMDIEEINWLLGLVMNRINQQKK